MVNSRLSRQASGVLAGCLRVLGPHLGRAFDRRLRLPSAPRILVISMGGIGDWVELTPLLRALAEGIPGAKVVALYDPRQRSLDLVRGLGLLAGEIAFDRTGADRGTRAKVRLR